MDTVNGIIPEEMMYHNQRKNVRTWLITQPWPAHIKREALFAWARTVGLKLQEWEVQQVVDSGIE